MIIIVPYLQKVCFDVAVRPYFGPYFRLEIYQLFLLEKKIIGEYIFPFFFRLVFPSDNAAGVDAKDYLPPVPDIPSVRPICSHRVVLALHTAWPRSRPGDDGDDHPAHTGRHVQRHRHNHPKGVLQLQARRVDGLLCHICLWNTPRVHLPHLPSGNPQLYP